MPSKILGLEIMDKDPLMEEVLDKFINSHEQTYEEFLSTFTHLSKDLLLLPGEADEDISSTVPSYLPSVHQPLTAEVKPKPTIKGKEPNEEVLGDEVQPFSLDEDFDYDNVTLTPKFTSAEIETMKLLLKQERNNTNTDADEPHN
ncbi:intraflagellar transport-associated protein isoform X2 [Cavia porcellus]|uniref:intraflagellar transport-associated protein isoform X2 n=1 Tax=Cavia porcellus TaxID=10141 RepID=UPI002FE14268